MLCPNCGKEHIGYECPNCNFDYSTDKQTFDSTNNTSNYSHNDNKFQYCCYCGNKLTHNSNFCPYCGKQLIDASFSYNTNNNNDNNTFNSFKQDNGISFSNYSNKVTSNYQNKKNEYQKKSLTLPIILIILMVILKIVSIVSLVQNLIKLNDFNYYTSSNSQIVDFDEEDSQPTINLPKQKKDYTSVYPNGISVSEFKKLKVGMTYEQVSYIIGGDGVVSSSNKNQTVVTWISEYNIKDSYVSITFTDKKVSKIEDFNLF